MRFSHVVPAGIADAGHEKLALGGREVGECILHEGSSVAQCNAAVELFLVEGLLMMLPAEGAAAGDADGAASVNGFHCFVPFLGGFLLYGLNRVDDDRAVVHALEHAAVEQRHLRVVGREAMDDSDDGSRAVVRPCGVVGDFVLVHLFSPC